MRFRKLNINQKVAAALCGFSYAIPIVLIMFLPIPFSARFLICWGYGYWMAPRAIATFEHIERYGS